MDLDAAIPRIEQARTRAALWDALIGIVRLEGIRMASYHHVLHDAHTADVFLRQEGFPEDWVCTYLEKRLYLVDPIPELALAGSDAFLWSDAGKLRRLSRHQSAYLDRLVASGLGDGLAMPVFGPQGRNGYIGLGFGGPAPPLKHEDIRRLQLVAQLGHWTYCSMVTSEATIAGLALSPREREVLDWVARGKSNSSIAAILGVSVSTVDTLMRRIFSKLGVNDRVSAAIRGVGAGVVHRAARS
jgi:DNA-binding CsgD family transcriptional regulator